MEAKLSKTFCQYLAIELIWKDGKNIVAISQTKVRRTFHSLPPLSIHPNTTRVYIFLQSPSSNKCISTIADQKSVYTVFKDHEIMWVSPPPQSISTVLDTDRLRKCCFFFVWRFHVMTYIMHMKTTDQYGQQVNGPSALWEMSTQQSCPRTAHMPLTCYLSVSVCVNTVGAQEIHRQWHCGDCVLRRKNTHRPQHLCFQLQPRICPGRTWSTKWKNLLQVSQDIHISIN